MVYEWESEGGALRNATRADKLIEVAEQWKARALEAEELLERIGGELDDAVIEVAAYLRARRP